MTLVKADLLDPPEKWEAVVEGCDYVLHTASPFILKPEDVQRDLLDPALKGTENVLLAVAKSKTVKKTVVTSSIAAIMCDKYDKGIDGYVYTEKDWNETASATYSPYYYSKTIAERRAWELATEHKFDLCCVNPTFVMGPTLSKTSSESITFMMNLITGKFSSGVIDNRNGFVDVRDVAEAHMIALENGKPGERYLCSHGMNEGVNYLQYANAVSTVYPSLSTNLPTRNFGKFVMYLFGPLRGFTWWNTYNNLGVQFKYDVSKIAGIGKKGWIDLDDSMRDMVKSLVDLKIADVSLE